MASGRKRPPAPVWLSALVAGTLAAALLLLVYWGLTLLYMPYTIPVLLLFSFWLPVSAAVMILYPALDKAFKLEETLAARRDAELDDYMADNDR